MVTLDRLILGANAFEGVSYTSRPQSLHYLEHFGNPDNVVAVLAAAHSLGVKTFTLSNTENVMAALEKFDKSEELTLLPVIPNVYEYARDASEKGVLGSILEKAKRIDMYQKIRFGLRALGKIKSVISKDVFDLLVELIDFELAAFRPYKIGAVLLHGQVTDLALSSRNKGLLELFFNLIRDNHGLEPMLATHNFGTLVPQLTEWGIKVPIMAPLNRKGFMMKPSQEACLKLVEEAGYPIIAKKVLAGGRLTPEEGFGYLADKRIISAVVGIGSVPEAYHSLSVARRVLKVTGG
jgi:hypothetical protein